MANDKSREPFSTQSPLTALEAAFVQAVEEARNFEPTADQLESDSCIRGGLIRAILMGMPLRRPAAGALRSRPRPRPARLTAHGIRIVPEASAPAKPPVAARRRPLLRITETVDLRGLGAEGGLALPPLEFGRCDFERPLELSGAHLQSLTLEGCRFSRLSARDAKFSGGVLLRSCGPRSDPVDEGERWFASQELVAGKTDPARLMPIEPAPEADPNPGCGCLLCRSADDADADECRLCCVIDFMSAEIVGNFDIESSYLRAPRLVGRTYRIPPRRDEWAALLIGIQVRDSLSITRSIVLGRVNLMSAEIADDVWILGGKFIASADRRTFDFQLATIGGLLVFQAADVDMKQETRSPVMVVGQIAGLGLNIGEVWIGEGFYYGQDRQRRGAYATINFAKSNVRGSFKIGAYYEYHVLDPERPTGVAHIHGEICLGAADIGKNLEMHGAYYGPVKSVCELDDEFYRYFGVDRDETPYLKLRAHGLKVDRRAFFSHGCLRDADRRPAASPDGAAAGACQKTGQPAAIDLWKSTIGTGLRIGENCTCIGAIRLNSCIVGREAAIACRTVEPAPAECCQADTERIPSLIDVAESTIRGHVKIGRREPRAEHDPDAHREMVTVQGGISLESAHVQGSVLFGHVTFDLARYPLPDGLPESDGARDDKRVALNLRDCTCGSDLEVHSLRWKLPDLTEAEKRCCSQASGQRFPSWPDRHCFWPIAEGSFAVVDLRGFECGMLVDGFGAEWGLIYRLRLRLAGIRIGDVEPSSHKAPHACSRKPEQARLRWLAFQNGRQRVVGETETDSKREPIGPGIWERFYCSHPDDFVPQAYDALSCVYRKVGEDWTSEQILLEKKSVQDTLRFRRLVGIWRDRIWPPAAMMLVMLLMAALWLAAMTAGLVPDNSAEAFRSAVVILIVSSLLLFWPFFVALFQFAFRFGFRYGLSANAALIVFLLCIVVGTAGVHVARNGGGTAVTDWRREMVGGRLNENIALVLDVEYEPARLEPVGSGERNAPDRPPGDSAGAGTAGRTVQPPAAGPGEPALPDIRDVATREAGLAVYAEASPCNLNVSSLLYALDVFIPLIDLDQERRCSIRDAPPYSVHDRYFWWRFFKALYELLGWVVTSLVILTITGVLRRDLER